MYDRIGISRGSSGDIHVHYVPCPSERIWAVRLEAVVDGGPGTERPSVGLWEIRSTSGSTADTYVVGETPEGFSETTPFSGSLPPDNLLVLFDIGPDSGEWGVALEFNDGDLREDRILVDSRDPTYLEPSEFTRAARDSC